MTTLNVPIALRGRSRCKPSTDYAPEEIEFFLAMDRYKRDAGRPFPTWVEVLDVLKSLGWLPPPTKTSEPDNASLGNVLSATRSIH